MASTPPQIRQERPESPDSDLSTASPAGSEHNRSSYFGGDDSFDHNIQSPQSPQSPRSPQSPQSPRSPRSPQSPQLLSPLQPVRSTPIVPIMDNNSNTSGSPDSDDDDLANSPSDHGNNAEPTVTQFQQDQRNRSSSPPFLPATVFQGSSNNNNHNLQHPQVKTPEPRNNTTTPTNEPITITNQNSSNQGNHNRSLYQTLNPIKTSINPTPRNILAAHTLSSPSTPGTLPNFDWDDFVTRYTESLSAADAQEQELLEEFQQLVQYFNVWASSSSAHDTDRAVKRLQTRERYVRLSEQNLAQRRKHLTEVVRAFQSALALLSQSS